MSDPLRQALAGEGPHTARSLAARLSAFDPDVIAEALEALAAQGVLERLEQPGEPAYRLADPSRYPLADRDVIVNPAGPRRSRPRP